MKINMQQWAQEIIDAKDVRNLPVLYFPVLKNMGISVPDSVNDPATIAKVMKEVLDKYPDTIAAIAGMDLTVDAQSFGVQVNFSEKQAPNIIDHILSGPEDIEALQLPDIHSGRTDIFTKGCEEGQKLITDRPIFGGMLGPFSLAANLLDINKCLKMTIKGKDNLHVLLDKCTTWLNDLFSKAGELFLPVSVFALYPETQDHNDYAADKAYCHQDHKILTGFSGIKVYGYERKYALDQKSPKSDN